MKAYVLTQYGSPESLELRELEVPVPADDEVLVRVRATSINDWDVSLVTGRPAYIRLIHGWLRPNVTIPGCDVAGVVESVGRNVTRFEPGDEVYGDLHRCGFGTWAELVCGNEDALRPKPPALSFTQAAALPHGATLAWQALHDVAGLRERERVLINGAGGGVGPIALRLAKLHGAEVTGVDRGDKLSLLRILGFDHVLDYRRNDFTREGETYDLILDVQTTRPPWAYARALADGGRYVTVGGSVFRLLQLASLGRWVGRRRGLSLRLLALQANRGLEELAPALAEGTILPVVDGPYPLAEIPQALHRFAEGRQHGRIAITCGAT